jgi:hypothetical protein
MPVNIPLASGLGRRLTETPFHRTAKPPEPELTAMHEVVDEHETATRSLLEGKVKVGIDQAVPFQLSSSGACIVELSQKPTARHDAGVAHETLRRRPATAPDGSGTARSVQLDPDHATAKGCGWPPGLSSKDPAAMHEVDVGQDTPPSFPSWAPVGTGMV